MSSAVSLLSVMVSTTTCFPQSNATEPLSAKIKKKEHYLQELMHVISNKAAAVISLPLYVEYLECFFKLLAACARHLLDKFG